MSKLIYLACPYTSPDETTRRDRVEAASWFAADLMAKHDFAVFSPITHGHQVYDHLPPKLGQDHSYWMRQCLPMLRRCDELILIPLPGWQASRGVEIELDFAASAHIPIGFIQSDAFECMTLHQPSIFWKRYDLYI